MNEAWTCPFCNRHATVGKDNKTTSSFHFNDGNKDGLLFVDVKTITCPNPSCKEYTINAALHKAKQAGSGWVNGALLQAWHLRPQSSAKPYPAYIPAPLIADYTEACLIRDLSPKASATLSRRCLQGMIRDFWGVTDKPNLYQEISVIENKVEPAIWAAISAVREVGNIGAHMEKDINLVIDVDPDEAQTLIQLIEMLFKEWYIARKERADLSASIVAMAEAKKAAKVPASEA